MSIQVLYKNNKNMMTYQVDLTMQELETIERGLMAYNQQLSDYAREQGEAETIADVLYKLSKA